MNILFLMQKMHSANSELEKDSVKREIENMFSSLSDEEKSVVQKEFLTGLHKKIDEGKKLVRRTDKRLKMSPSEAALCGIASAVPNNYGWRKDVEEEMYKEYMEVR